MHKRAACGRDFERVKSLLKAGELVALPTETVYGLAGNALDPMALAKIFETKDRPHFDPLIVHCRGMEQVKSFVNGWDEVTEKLFKEFAPGPLTLLLPQNEKIPALCNAGLDKTAFRIPSHQDFQAVLAGLDFPLAAPSANPFGYVSPTTAAHVLAQLGQRIDYVLDGGNCVHGLESTVVEPIEGVLIVRRWGAITKEELEANGWKVSEAVNHSSNPRSPGELASHYSPSKKLEVMPREQILNWVGKWGNDPQTAVILFSEQLEGLPTEHQFFLSQMGDLREAAASLFAVLRALDQSSYSQIVAEWLPDEGLGRAMNDRLKRASRKSE